MLLAHLVDSSLSSPSSLPFIFSLPHCATKEWQLRMVGIEAGDPETEETDLDGEDGFLNRRRPVGAINPLLVAQDEGMKC